MNVANEMPGKVLVIDDERGPRESLRILLKNECHVFCADSVDAGWLCSNSTTPTSSSWISGCPAKTGSRDCEGFANGIPPYRSSCSPASALGNAQEAIRLGANEYIKKPFDTYELQDIVRRHVHRSRAERRRRHVEQDLGRSIRRFRRNWPTRTCWPRWAKVRRVSS